MSLAGRQSPAIPTLPSAYPDPLPGLGLPGASVTSLHFHESRRRCRGSGRGYGAGALHLLW